MEEAKALIRTAVRSFFNEPKQILIIDALMLHGALHIDDIHDLTGLQNKEARSHIQPLLTLRFITSSLHKELNLKTNKAQDRVYYWCKFSDAVNVIKYRIIHLRQDITTEYQVKAGPDFWLCPRCKNTYKELDIIPSGPESSMLCLRCGHELEINPAATQDKDSHEGIMKLNQQLSKFNSLILAVDRKIDRGEFREPAFEETFNRRKRIPFEISQRNQDNWAPLKQGRERDKAAGAVNENDININLTSAAALSKEEAEREAERKRRLADTSLLPEWHQGGVVRGDSSLDIRGGGERGTTTTNSSAPNGATASLGTRLKVEDEDEKKPILTANTTSSKDSTTNANPAPIKPEKERTEQDIMEQYMLDMQREQAEADRRRQQAETAETDSHDDDDEDDEDDEFEDVPGTSSGGAGTPAAATAAGGGGGSSNNSTTQNPAAAATLLSHKLNGIKRELAEVSEDGDSSAAPSPDAKKVKREAIPTPLEDVESEEEEFEDV